MKNLLFLLLILSTSSCKNNSKTSKGNEVLIENKDKQDHNNESKTYLKTQINGKEIKETYCDFSGGGSTVSGLINELKIEFTKDVFGKKNFIIKFNCTKKTLPPKLQLGTYNLKGFESDQDYIENNKEDTFYCNDAITMNVYTNIIEKYPNITKDIFLSTFGTDLVVMPDEKNKFYIESIEEINDDEFLIKGNFQLKLMKFPSKEEFLFSSQFKTEYDYSYYSGS